jgi:serine/threonine-protein kinase RsbW
MTRRATFPGRPDEVRTARRFVAKSLNGCSTAGDAVLLVSELATNAVAHSRSGRGGSFTVTVIHRAGDVRVQVADQGGIWAPGESDRGENKRGLLVVFTLARACGITGDDSGRVAWFELRCP